jgi:hypothetical protein
VTASPLPFEPIATATIDPPQAEGLPLELVDAQIEPAVAAGSRDRETSLRREPDISAAADLCTRLGRVADGREMGRVLEDAARLLDAVGLIAWYWDSCAQALRPWLAQGYSEAVLAQTQAIRRDAANAIADAYRSAETCVVNGDDEVTGAVAVPLMAPTGCVGVLALELRHGGEQLPSVRALATILAAQLVTLLGSDPLPEAVSA